MQTTFRAAVRLRWRDFDALGHVNYATYLTLLEEARDECLEAVGIAPEGYVVVSVDINYLSEIIASDGPVSVEICVRRMGKSSITTNERIFSSAGIEKSRAAVTIVLWDPATRSSRPLTIRERESLSHLAADALEPGQSA